MLLAKQAEETQQKDDIDPWDTTVQNKSVHCGEIASKAAAALSLPLPVF